MDQKPCPDCGAPLASRALGEACPHCLARIILVDEETDLIESLPRKFGGYELLERVAQGGMGVVYRARHLALRRTVAIKVLLAGEFASREFVQRFRHEAASAAILQHPNIVAIHEAGIHEGQHYLSMDYVDGQNLDQLIGVTPLAPIRAARYVRTIAQAIQFAHEHGVLHRDLKPSNIIIDHADQPRVTDFGLARRLDQSLDLTVTGQVLGSPGFIPPEQAGATAWPIGPASDVYSLGAILYHALTARPPFQGETLPQILRQAIETDPVPPRRLNPGIPVELETICLKCLAKEPARRYASARELADELDRFLHQEPILARPIGRLARLRRWCQRRPTQALLLAGFILALISGLAGIVRELRRAERAEQATVEQLGRAYLDQARANRRSGRQGQRFETLQLIRKAAALPAAPSRLDLRNEAIAALALPDLRWIRESPSRPGFIGLDGAGQRYAWVEPEGTVRVHATADDREILTLPAPATTHRSWPCFSADGRLLAVTDRTGRIRAWRLPEGQLIAELQLDSGNQRAQLEFSPDGATLGAIGSDQVIRLFNLTSGLLEREFPLPFRPARLDFSPDGQRLATMASGSKRVRLFDLASGQSRELSHPFPIRDLAWNPQRPQIALCSDDPTIVCWDLDELQAERIATDHQSALTHLTFHPEGELLASTSWDGTTAIWELATGRRRAGILHSLEEPRFSADGARLLATTGQLRRVQVIEFEARRAGRFLARPMPVPDQPQRAWSVDWNNDGRLLAAATTDGVRLWDSRDGRLLGLLPHAEARSVWFDPQGGRLYSVGQSSTRLWPLTGPSTNAEWTAGSPQSISSGEDYSYGGTSRDGRTIAYLHAKIASVWTNQQRAFHLRLGAPGRIAVSPDGRWICATEGANELKLWSSAGGAPVWTNVFTPTLYAGVVFSPDSRWVVTGARDAFTFWEADTGRPGFRFPRRETGDFQGTAAFSPDGRVVALTVTRTLVQLRNAATGEELAQLESPTPHMIVGMGFSPDNAHLAVLGEAHSLEVWDLQTLRRDLASIDLDWPQPNLAPAAAVPTSPAKLRVSGPKASIPPPPARPSEMQVDLTKFYTGSLTQMWPEVPGNNLDALPAGVHQFNRIPFDLRGTIALRSRRLPQLPASVRDIRIEHTASRLHFLHGAGYTVPDGTKIGAYLVHYADGDQLEVPLIAGYTTWNWWRRPSAPPPGTNLVWTGTNAAARNAGYQLHLYHLAWDNPRPDQAIQRLDFVSTVTESSPFLLAITAE